MTYRRSGCLGLLLALAVGIAGCGLQPGDRGIADPPDAQTTPWAGEFEKTVLLYGGVYKEPKLNRWLTSVGRGLAAHAGRSDIAFTFTILDTGEVNAFSTPGGFVYVTRGLLTLADNEAEVAAALSHEMAHLIRGDQAERYRESQRTGIADLLSGVPGWGRKDSVLAAERARFTQDQELSADEAGIGIMSASGYDPRAMASLLTALDRESRATENIAPLAVAFSNASYTDSHPLSADRVAAENRLADLSRNSGDQLGRDIFLRAIDGAVYGPGVEQGFVRDQMFVHPRAGIAVRLPPGFVARNGGSAFVATRSDGAVFLLTSASPKTSATPLEYLTQFWARDLQIRSSDPIVANGRPAAVASSRVDSDRGPAEVRLAVIGWSPSLVYRLVFIAPAGVDLDDCVTSTVNSFRPLSSGDEQQLRPLRLHVVAARGRDTVAKFVRRMASDIAGADTFRTLNRLTQGDAIRPGWQYKLVE